jgi:hypothetical protein
MQNESISLHGVMEAKGSYNRNARIPAGGAALALQLLQEAVERMRFGDRDSPVMVGDYGSSQGKNSLPPIHVVIIYLRERVRSGKPIFVFHIDQPTNDFNTLFEVLDKDPDRYTRDEPNVFPCAIGRSFYEQVLPSESVHPAWSSYAAVWLSRIPGPIPGHFVAHMAAGAAHAVFEHQAARDWETFSRCEHAN